MNSVIRLATPIVIGFTIVAHAQDSFLPRGNSYNNGTCAKGYVKGTRNAEDVGNFVGTLVITPEDRANAKMAVDWTSITSPVKMQGTCGSCWAFATTEGVETAVYIAAGQQGPVPLFSAQQITSCDALTGENGCDGGDPMNALEYVYEVGGLDTESDYPYNNEDSSVTTPCTWDDKYIAMSINWWYTVDPCLVGDCKFQDEDGLAAAVSKHGPMTVCLFANWPNYVGWTFDGVYPGLNGTCSSDADKTDHCVQVVGYDRTGVTLPPYWLIRNQWSETWGDNGYIRIPYGSNACGIANEVYFVGVSLASGTKMTKPPEPQLVQHVVSHSTSNSDVSAKDNMTILV